MLFLINTWPIDQRLRTFTMIGIGTIKLHNNWTWLNSTKWFCEKIEKFKFLKCFVDSLLCIDSLLSTDEIVPFISNKTIYINCKQWHSFVVNASNNIITRVIEELSCPDHKEVDTKIVYGIKNQANIVKYWYWHCSYHA